MDQKDYSNVLNLTLGLYLPVRWDESEDATEIG